MMDFEWRRKMRLIFVMSCVNGLYTTLLTRRPCALTLASNAIIATVAYKSLKP